MPLPHLSIGALFDRPSEYSVSWLIDFHGTAMRSLGFRSSVFSAFQLHMSNATEGGSHPTTRQPSPGCPCDFKALLALMLETCSRRSLDTLTRQVFRPHLARYSPPTPNLCPSPSIAVLNDGNPKSFFVRIMLYFFSRCSGWCVKGEYPRG